LYVWIWLKADFTVAASPAAFFSSSTPSGSPFTKTTMSGRRLCWPLIIVNWLTARKSFRVEVLEVHQPHEGRPPMEPSLRAYSTGNAVHEPRVEIVVRIHQQRACRCAWTLRYASSSASAGNLWIQALDGGA